MGDFGDILRDYSIGQSPAVPAPSSQKPDQGWRIYHSNSPPTAAPPAYNPEFIQNETRPQRNNIRVSNGTRGKKTKILMGSIIIVLLMVEVLKQVRSIVLLLVMVRMDTITGAIKMCQ